MNWNNCAFIILIITFVFSTTIEARGGRGGGGRSSGGGRRSGSSSSSRSSGSGSGGFWSSIFGGSSSKSKSSSSHSSSSSSSSNWKPPQHTSYNSYPYYQHTSNYDNGYGARPPKTSDSRDFMHGYVTGNLISHDFSSLRVPDNIFYTNSEHKVSETSNNGYLHPRLLVITNDQAEPMAATSTTTEMSTGGMLDILNELNKPFDSNESLDAFLNRMSKIDFTKVFNPTNIIAETTVTTPSTTSEMPISSTELPNTNTESSTMDLKLTSSTLPPTTESNTNNVDPHLSTPATDELLSTLKTSPSNTVPTTTESTQEAKLDISTPYGLICSPITYNEVNEFGVNIIIERLGCYPALEPVAPLD